MDVVSDASGVAVMVELLLFVLIGFSVAVLALLVLVWRRSTGSDLVIRLDAIDRAQERVERGVREEISRSREESLAQGRSLREEVLGQMTALARSTETRHESLRGVVEKKLEEMRLTVDEKLQGTLEKRLGESFKLVSERLEQVHKGLGEMQVLASGVGDLKKVLSNVKVRGTWGEIQLGNLLEQMLTPEQFGHNVQIRKGSGEIVEFAIRLPGDDVASVVWLPVDSKFPREDYERLQSAQDRGDAEGAEAASKQLEAQIRRCARDIRDKYIHPPDSTDFAILFLPVESLFAEALRRPGLIDGLQREFRVTVAGPTTLAALLNSLQMGFRTLAIQKRSSEVWKVLGAVKSEFGKFGEILDKVGKKLQEAQNTIGDAATKSRTIERKLRNIEELPAPEASGVLELGMEPVEE